MPLLMSEVCLHQFPTGQKLAGPAAGVCLSQLPKSATGNERALHVAKAQTWQSPGGSSYGLEQVLQAVHAWGTTWLL